MNEADKFLAQHQKRNPNTAHHQAEKSELQAASATDDTACDKCISTPQKEFKETHAKEAGEGFQNKHIIALVVGIILTVVSRSIGLNHPGGYTAGYYLVLYGMTLLSYSICLAIVALIIAAVRGNVRMHFFAAFAWLFLSAGIFAIFSKGMIHAMLSNI